MPFKRNDLPPQLSHGGGRELFMGGVMGMEERPGLSQLDPNHVSYPSPR